jgi:hypothetical protein
MRTRPRFLITIDIAKVLLAIAAIATALRGCGWDG